MLKSHNTITQVEEALGTPKILDRDLVRDLLNLAKALEIALVEACRTNLELRAMDKNVAGAANVLRDAIDALNQSYTQEVEVGDSELDDLVTNHIKTAQNMLAAEKQASS